MTQNLLLVWGTTQTACMLMLWIGSQLKENRLFLWIGEVAHRRKMAALDRYWPLTLIRPAVKKGDLMTCMFVLSLLILLKSIFCLLLGLIVVFWLPFASLLIPSIVGAHKPGDKRLLRDVSWVALLQVTSHSTAAAIGFVLSVAYWKSHAIFDNQAMQTVTLSLGIATSIGFAIAAGFYESKMLQNHGL